MINLIHLNYGLLKADIESKKLGEAWKLVGGPDDTFLDKFACKTLINDHKSKFVDLCIYNYNDLTIMDHTSSEVDLWNIRQATPFDIKTLAPELIPYITYDTIKELDNI